jgi:O-antigen ligase
VSLWGPEAPALAPRRGQSGRLAAAALGTGVRRQPELSTAWHVEIQQRRIVLLAVLAVLASLICVGLVLLLHFVVPVVLLTCVALAAIARRPRVGVYLVFGLCLLFETTAEYDPLMLPGAFLHRSLNDTLALPGVIVTPLEVLLLLTFVSWLAQSSMRRRLDFRGGRLVWPLLLFGLALAYGLARGPLSGGDLYVGLWEARALLYLVACYFLAANTIRTRHHLGALMAITLLATSLLAIEGIYRYVALISTGMISGDMVYEHGDALFFGLALLLVLAQQVFGAPRWQRVLGPGLVPIVTYTLLVSLRRGGYIATLVAFLAFALVFLVARRKSFLLTALPLLLGGAIYLPLFWNHTGLLGQPARAIRSLSAPDARDAASNGYRDLEKINIRATIAADPLLGIGFGRKFLFVVPLPDLSFWPFWHYEPHNNILWIWLKTGAGGFIVFWVLMGTALARAAHLARTERGPPVRVFALLALGSIIATLVYSYVDTMLVGGRETVVLGTIMGTLAVLDQVDDEATRLGA